MKKLLLILSFFPLLSFGQNMFSQDDKKAHLMAGAAISATTYHVVLKITDNQNKAIIWSIVSTSIIATGKEVVDLKIRKTGFDKKDIAATMCGCIIVLPLYIFDKKVKH